MAHQSKDKQQIDDFFPNNPDCFPKKEAARLSQSRVGPCRGYYGVMLMGVGFVVGFAGGFAGGFYVGQLNSK
jgi:hypothetical protein